MDRIATLTLPILTTLIGSAIAGTSRIHSRITKVIRNASTWLRVSDDAKQPMAA